MPLTAAKALDSELGFTLIELIMVIVVLGVLAVFAAPRILNTADFYARGFHDESLGYLRYAQKVAIAQRRTVCVVFGTGSTGSVTLTVAATADTFNCSTAGTLLGPKGENPVVLVARTGVQYGSVPADFNFDGLGQPITATGAAQGTQTFQVAGTGKSITVESTTGYAHD